MSGETFNPNEHKFVKGESGERSAWVPKTAEDDALIAQARADAEDPYETVLAKTRLDNSDPQYDDDDRRSDRGAIEKIKAKATSEGDKAASKYYKSGQYQKDLENEPTQTSEKKRDENSPETRALQEYLDKTAKRWTSEDMQSLFMIIGKEVLDSESSDIEKKDKIDSVFEFMKQKAELAKASRFIRGEGEITIGTDDDHKPLSVDSISIEQIEKSLGNKLGGDFSDLYSLSAEPDTYSQYRAKGVANLDYSKVNETIPEEDKSIFWLEAALMPFLERFGKFDDEALKMASKSLGKTEQETIMTYFLGVFNAKRNSETDTYLDQYKIIWNEQKKTYVALQ